MGLKEWAAEQQERSTRLNLERHAAKVNGRPWWECSLPQFVVEYKSVDALNAELPIATEHGWELDNTAAAGSHINVGRTVTSAALTGGISLLFGASRSKGKTTIVWKRSARPA